jgi:hypothetical protein
MGIFPWPRTVVTIDITALKRAITAVWKVGALHGLLFIRGLYEMVRRETGSTKLEDLLPEHLTRLPAGTAELRTHPAYRWLSGLAPDRLFPVSVALLAAQLATEPDMLQVVENYGDQLAAVLEPTEANQLDTLRHLKDVIAGR